MVVVIVAFQSCQYKKARESDVHGPKDELCDKGPLSSNKMAASNCSRKKSRQVGKSRYRDTKSSMS